jgi:hypothetical protein
MLQGIDPEYEKQVASVLKWLAFSKRPLLLDELAEIFILDPEKAMPFDESDRLFTVEEVLTYLPGVVTKAPIPSYTEYRSVSNFANAMEIRFAHFSIKEYLSSSRISRVYYSTPEQTAHLHISECCLAYHLQLSESMMVTEDDLGRYALCEYAAQYWLDHLEKVALESWTISVTNRAKRVFVTQSQSLLNMVRIGSYYDGELESDWEMTPNKLESPIFYAASIGAFQLVSLLIRDGADVNEVSPAASHDTVLQEAIFRHRKAIIKLLLEHGADVNAQGGYFGNALQEAVFAEDQDVVQLLISNGAQVNAEGGKYGTALQTAAAWGHLEILQVLLDNGAQVNAEGGKYGTALQGAAARGKLNILQVLLDNGADVNVKGGRYGNALQAAVGEDNLAIAQLLLERGASVYPTGLEWVQLIARVDREGLDADSNWLRKFQENPTGYLESRRRKPEEEETESEYSFDRSFLRRTRGFNFRGPPPRPSRK